MEGPGPRVLPGSCLALWSLDSSLPGHLPGQKQADGGVSPDLRLIQQPLENLGSWKGGAPRPTSPTGLSADSENSYVLSCGVPGLQGRTQPKRNGTSSGTGPGCSGSPWPVHATHACVILGFASGAMLGGPWAQPGGDSGLEPACPGILGTRQGQKAAA